MKIVILADSLALPREEVGGERCFEAAYPFLIYDSLMRKFGARAPMIIERGMRLRTIEAVLTDWHEQVDLRHADVVIVHVGVVDCALRVFLRREHAFIARMRSEWIRKQILNFAHNHRKAIIQRRPRVYVPLPRFKLHVEEVVQKARNSNLKSLVFVNIVSPPDAIEARSPGFQSNVARYNEVLSAQAEDPRVTVIDFNKAIAENGGSAALTVDGVHLNETAHQLLARPLTTHIEDLVKRDAELNFSEENQLNVEQKI